LARPTRAVTSSDGAPNGDTAAVDPKDDDEDDEKGPAATSEVEDGKCVGGGSGTTLDSEWKKVSLSMGDRGLVVVVTAREEVGDSIDDDAAVEASSMSVAARAS